jgi:hypothetical protein
MPIRISELRKETRPVDIEWDGETVRVEYRPGAVTAQMQMAAASMAPPSTKYQYGITHSNVSPRSYGVWLCLCIISNMHDSRNY